MFLVLSSGYSLPAKVTSSLYIFNYAASFYLLESIMCQDKAFAPENSCLLESIMCQGKAFARVVFCLLESVMCKGFICLSHLVHIFFLLYRCTCIICCIKNFISKLFFHCLLASVTRICCKPTKC